MRNINIFLFVILIFAIIGTIALFKTMRVDHKKKEQYPIFLSTKYSISNIRSGPGKEYPIIWIYKVLHTPVKVIAEYHGWYQIEDYSGKIGWIFENTTSKQITAFTKEKVFVYSSPDINSDKVATIDKGIILSIKSTDSSKQFQKVYLPLRKIKITGWVLKTQLWGNLSN